MFRCRLCNRLSAPRERSCKIVMETRPKEYYEEIRGRMHLVGTGREIAKEVMMCRGCGEKVAYKQAQHDLIIYGTGVVRVLPDGQPVHVPLEKALKLLKED